jgi:hypothetical protein
VRLEEKNVEEFEDTLIRISCGQSFAENEIKEELSMQMGFVSAIRCHDKCAMQLLNQDVPKFRSI